MDAGLSSENRDRVRVSAAGVARRDRAARARHPRRGASLIPAASSAILRVPERE